MNRKKLALMAIVTVIVFGGAVVIYPLMFHPGASPAVQTEVSPAPVSPVK